jgi:hypothetical protein
MFGGDETLFDSDLINNRIDYASKVASTYKGLNDRNCFLFFSLLHDSIKGQLFQVGSRFPNLLLEHHLVDVVRLAMQPIDRNNSIHSSSETTASHESLDDSCADLQLTLLDRNLIACSFDCERELNLGPENR